MCCQLEGKRMTLIISEKDLLSRIKLKTSFSFPTLTLQICLQLISNKLKMEQKYTTLEALKM